jgi:hypothetical protein
VRGGYWIDPVPWLGVAGNLSTFEADAADVRFRIVPFSVLVMFRLPLLATDEIPEDGARSRSGWTRSSTPTTS